MPFMLEYICPVCRVMRVPTYFDGAFHCDVCQALVWPEAAAPPQPAKWVRTDGDSFSLGLQVDARSVHPAVNWVIRAGVFAIWLVATIRHPRNPITDGGALLGLLAAELMVVVVNWQKQRPRLNMAGSVLQAFAPGKGTPRLTLDMGEGTQIYASSAAADEGLAIVARTPAGTDELLLVMPESSNLATVRYAVWLIAERLRLPPVVATWRAVPDAPADFSCPTCRHTEKSAWWTAGETFCCPLCRSIQWGEDDLAFAPPCTVSRVGAECRISWRADWSILPAGSFRVAVLLLCMGSLGAAGWAMFSPPFAFSLTLALIFTGVSAVYMFVRDLLGEKEARVDAHQLRVQATFPYFERVRLARDEIEALYASVTDLVPSSRIADHPPRFRFFGSLVGYPIMARCIDASVVKLGEAQTPRQARAVLQALKRELGLAEA